ncbi:MAG: carboxypeptidase regulatory-like domain-containing protein, partial [Flavisolibacter sp.]
MKCLLICLGFLMSYPSFAQQHPGIIMGNVLDEKNQALEGATVQLIRFSDSSKLSTVTDKNGAFLLSSLPFGYYKFRVSFVGFNTLTLDSIHFRTERFDFNLNDVVLKIPVEGNNMEEVIVYLEKPLIQSKDGNITFNAGESALSAGSNASELLTSVPLVTKDPSGRLLVRGKEPRILIDDKPVELNLEQLQDLLESMPGSSIEKIEVMTNPPAQYANEQGGVINITTKKGSVGMSGRISAFLGSRGQAGGNGSFNYRKQGLSLNINAGAGYNRFEGEAYSRRRNLNNNRHFNNNSEYINRSMRPNFRMNLNYEVNKFHALNMVLQYNQNSYDNQNITNYRNLDGAGQVIHLSERKIINRGDNYNPNVSFTYTVKTKKPGESLRLITSFNHSGHNSQRDFFHQYFNPDQTPNGKDSVMQQLN